MSTKKFYHEFPDRLAVETDVLDATPGRVRLELCPFFAGGGGQLPDRGLLRWNEGEASVSGFEQVDGATWVLLDTDVVVHGPVQAEVDPGFRRMMQELHTDTHLLNAFVFQNFDGALVTGVQMNDDGTARMDFDLPDADSERLRQVEGMINDAIRQGLAVTDDYIPLGDATAEHGLIRTRSAAPPPTSDGKVRIVEIAGLDRQACGGTHLPRTDMSRPVRVLKIDNKGRHNRRVRIGLVEPGSA